MAMIADIKDRSFYAWTPIAEGSTAVASTCLNCPPRSMRLSWRYSPYPGFGVVALRRDGKIVAGAGEKGCLATMRAWRQRASDDPRHVWQIEVSTPMSGVLYTRLAHREWIATHRNPGFA
jgi:hypothetical protein